MLTTALYFRIMKYIAINSLNQPVDNGVKRNRSQWQKWGNKLLTEREKKMGWACVVSFFDGYFRVNFAGQRKDFRCNVRGNTLA